MIESDGKISYKQVDFNPFEEEKEIDKIVSANEPQKEIWLSCVIGGDESNLAYNESVSLDLKGFFQPVYFQEAILEVVARHEALRSAVSANGETLIIYKNIPVHIPLEDISAQADQAAVLEKFVTEEMLRVFDLQEGPLFRAYLHKLTDTHYYFTLVLHHIIADGWSTGVILEELCKIYNAKLSGSSLLLETAPQMSKYAEELVDFNKSKAFQETENFWLNMYRDSIPVMDLPTDYPRPATRSYKSSRTDHSLPPDLVDLLKAAGAKAGCSLVNTMLSAFEIFLYQQTNQRDIVVGMPAAGQSATENFGLIGHCVNLLPLRTLIDPGMSFIHYLKKRKADFFNAYDHQKFTYGQLIKKLNIKRDHSRIPIVPVVFNIDMGMDTGVKFDHLEYRLISNPRAYETFELFLNMNKYGPLFTLEWSYNTQLFKKETIEKMAADFELLLQSLASNPSVTLRELSLKNTEEWREKLAQWNDTAAAYPADNHIYELISQTQHKFPDKTAIVYQNQSLSYTQLTDRSNQLAAYLIEKGIKTGDLIGLAAERSIEMVISLLGILKAGAAYVPLDPEYPRERIEYMLADSNALLLIVSKAFSGKFQSNAAEIIIEELWPELDNYTTADPAIPARGTDLAYVLYTSGSTGKPKGVKIMHHNLINFLTSMQSEPGMTPEDRLLAITTISFDIAGLELYLPLITGAELMICDTATAKDGRLLLDLLEEKKITVMQATPSTWRMMIDSGWNKKYALKVLCGGEALPDELAESLLKRSAELWNMYGPTETTIWSTLKQIRNGEEPLTIGRPIQNTQVYILNEEHNLVAPGTTGEIFIGGDGVAAGYLNQPALTQERFISHLFSEGADHKLYKTGDLGKFMENGEIMCQGRIDQQVKIRGHRIELGEIENLICKQEGIKQSVVLAREDNPGDKRLVAYVSLTDEIAGLQEETPNNELNISKSVTDSWKEALKMQLPDYMVPNDFVVLKLFPLTPNHKIDRKALPKPLTKITLSEITGNLPRNDDEQLISDIWSSVLNLENIPVQDDFFEIGGHSLLAVKVMAAIEKETGKRLPLATLFENATIEKLAKKIYTDDVEKWDALVPIKTSGTKAPIYLIHGAGLNVLLFRSIGKYLDKEQPVYGLQALGLNRPAQLLYTIEEIAAAYISEILQVDPKGPYCLAGYSLGGFIAYEIARQLTGMGKEIKFLGILDTYAGDLGSPENSSVRLTKKVKRQFNKIPFFTRSFLNSPKEAFNYQIDVFKYKIDSLFSAEPESEVKHFTPYEKDIYKSYDVAHGQYSLVPAEIKICLFNVQKRLYYLDDLVYLGWDKFAKKGVEIYGVPGDHKTFLYPPNDKEFAEILQSVLDKI